MKNSSQKKWKRILAMVVAVVMVIGLCPAMAWVKAADPTPVTLTLTGAMFGGGGADSGTTNSSNIWLAGNANGIASPEWNAFQPVDETDGIWVEGERDTDAYLVNHNNAGGWFATGFTATEGQTITIKGTFKYDESSYVEIQEVQFKWDGSAWEEVINATPVTLTLTGALFNGGGADSGTTNCSYLWLAGSASGLASPNFETFAPVDSTAGIWVEDQRIDGGVLLNHSEQTNGWRAQGFTATAGQTVTIKGIFKYESSYVEIQEVQFKWDGSAWKEVMSTTPVTLTLTDALFGGGGADSGTTNCSYLWLSGSASGLESPNFEEFAPVDSTAGIWVEDQRIDGGVLLNHSEQTNGWRAQGFTATAGQTVTIKGIFKYESSYVEIEEVKFKWTGSKWEDYVEYTDIRLTGMSASTSLGGSNWSAYFPVSTSLPGDAWGAVDEVPETYSVLVSVNGQEASTCTAKNAGGEGLFVEIPTSLLNQNENATVVIKAGEYKNSLQNIGIRLTEDFTFYASKYGWSTKDTILEVAAKPFFTKVVAGEAYSGNGITLNSNIDDGAEYDGGWEKKLYPVIKGLKYDKNGVTDTSTLYFDCGENGLWKGSGAEATFTNAKNMPLVKLGPTNYVAYIGDTGNKGEISGDTFIVGGLFHDENGRLIEFERIQVTWNGSDWTQTFLAMDDTGLEADLNADGVTDSHDLVRMLRHWKDEKVSINTAKRDINNDGVFDASDVVALRKILVGKLSYYGGTEEGSSVPYGTPTYSTKRVIEKTAYSCPAVGTWNEEKTEFTPYADADIDTALQKYKAAGFTLLNSEFVAEFADKDFADEANEPLRVLLEAAQRNGLGVIVSSAYINTALRQDDLANSAYSGWKTVVSSLVSLLLPYPAFKGFMMSDELSIQYADNYAAMTEFIHENYPNLVLHSSQLPVTAYTVSGLGAAALTKDTTTNNTKELAYKDYVKNFGTANGMYTFDMYPLIYSADKIFGSVTSSEYSVNSEWYDNLKWVSDVVKEKGFKTGVTIQSCKLAGTNSLWSTYERYAPTEKADIGFQIYTAMAYGMQEFNYYTYMDHPSDTTVEDAMNDNTQVYAAVQSINQEIDSFANAFKAFTWKDTLDIAAGGSNTSTGNARLQSAASTGGRAFVGCMKDADGFDGYMVANAEGPRAGKTATVTLTFKSATKAMIYKGTSCETVSLTDGVCTVSLAAGEGAFVIPIR